MIDNQHNSPNAVKSRLRRLVLFLMACLICTAVLSQAFADDEDQSSDSEDALPAGAIRFKVAFTKGINTNDVREGQKVEGTLQEDLKVNGQVVAPSGSRILGRIEKLNHSRSLPKSFVSTQKRFRMHSSLVITFNRIITPAKQEMNIVGLACKQYSVFSNGHTARVIQVGPYGELLKTGDESFVKDQGMGLSFPKSWVTFKGHFQLDIEPGDQLLVQATIPYGLDVSAQVVKDPAK